MSYGNKKVPEMRFTLPTGNYHLAIFGETGLGKSVTLKVVAESKYEMGWKILDMYDGASCENCFWCMESDDNFWANGKKRGRESQNYPTELLVPLIVSKLPKKLPTICNIFTIPIKTISSDDIKALLGKKISTSVSTLWSVVQKNLKDDTTGEELLEIIRQSTITDKTQVGGGKQGLTVLYNALEPLVREGLLSNSKSTTSIDIKTIVKNKKTISSLVLKFVPHAIGGINLRSFLVQYIIRRLWELKQESGIVKAKVCILMREATDFLAKGSIGEMGESDLAVRDIIARVIKQGRKFNLVTIIDAQSPSLLYGSIDGQFRVVLAHRIQDYDDLDKVVSPAVKSQITMDFKWKIGELPRQRVAVLKPREMDNQGKPKGVGSFLTKVLPPRSRYMREGDDFFEIFEKSRGNEMVFTSNIIEQIEKEKERFGIEQDYKNKEEEKKEFVEKIAKELRKRNIEPMSQEEGRAILFSDPDED